MDHVEASSFALGFNPGFGEVDERVLAEILTNCGTERKLATTHDKRVKVSVNKLTEVSLYDTATAA